MSTTSTITTLPDGKLALTITMDTEADALALAASLGSISTARVREVAQTYEAEVCDKIESVLDRSGWATPTYGAFDLLMATLKIK